MRVSIPPRSRLSVWLTVAAMPMLVSLVCVRAAHPQAESGKIDASEAQAVQHTVQEVRMLKLKQNIPIVVRDTEQAGKLLEAELDEEYTPETIDTDGRAGAMIGLYPPGIDLKAANMSLLESQVIAFYDFKKKTMVIVKGALQREFPGQPAEVQDKLQKMILAHEYTHALQDQNFDFGARDDALKGNGDRALALHSVAEGDATISGYACMLGHIDPVILATLIANLGSFSQTFTGAAQGVPRGVAEPLIFEYTQGVKFVAEAFQRGGWKAVDKLYSDPPQSSQQIMDPSLYFDHPLLPDTITVRGYEAAMPGWRKSDEDTLGELGLRIILENSFGSSSPEIAMADKWAGDRIVMLRKGSVVSVVWLIAFRDNDSASRFSDAYRRALGRIRGRPTAHSVEAKGNALLVAIGESAVHFSRLAPAVWKASTIRIPAPAISPESHPLQAQAPQGGQRISARLAAAH
jgi:hypothetical protein